MKHNVLRSLQSFALFPIFAANLLTPGGVPKTPTVAVLSSAEIRPLVDITTDNKQEVFDEKVKKVEAYFADKNLPIAEHAEALVREAEKNNLDWTFVAAFAMAESTGCKFMHNNNCFGWGSAKIRFDSIEHGIEVVAWNLGGNNPATARYYKDKTIDQIINTYNPPVYNPKYFGIIKHVMKSIKDYPIETESKALATL